MGLVIILLLIKTKKNNTCSTNVIINSNNTENKNTNKHSQITLWGRRSNLRPARNSKT